jgi:hypothetical protein|tara:strand:- start:6298 stop:6486 length:189 start_codon:yes stop_codon:yes gene_type:complete
MISNNLIIQSDTVNYLCTVCVSDNNGAKIALTIIISSLVVLALGNWAWKKYFVDKKEITQQK